MESQQNKQEIQIDLGRVLKVLLKKSWIIAIVSVVLAAAGYIAAYMLITPAYSANVKMYVNNSFNDEPGVSSSQISAAQDLARTYMTILMSRNVLADVAKQSGLNYTDDELRNMITTNALNKTELFQVTVTCDNYKHAAIIANAIADVLPGKVEQIVEGTSVRVVDRAVENATRVDAGYSHYAMIGGVTGLILSIATIVILDVMDTTIEAENYLTYKYSGTPLLAVVPGTENPKGSSYRGYRGYYKGYYQTVEKNTKKQKSGGAK